MTLTVPARPGPRRRAVRLSLSVAIALLTLGALLPLSTLSSSAATPTPTPTATPTPTPVPNPLAAVPFYVDPNTWAQWAVTAYPANAAANQRIASTPQARWFGDWSPTSQVRAEVNGYVTAATAAKRLPVLVLYAIPHRDCGGFSAGGLTSQAAYAAWIWQVVLGIDSRRAAVVVEPDALASLDCLSAADRSDRYAMLKAAVTKLSSYPQIAVYLDAGHSQWLTPAEAATRLTAAGVSAARGFSLNVSNFLPTAGEVAYGEKVSALVGGKRYVVDTSRNGLGPAPAAPLNWCNPAGRGLGVRPTTVTAGAHADAYLWVKHPGESDGDCNRGDPPSGTWFNTYATGLVQRALTG